MEQLGQPATERVTEKAKEGEVFTCRRCTCKYTDASGRGGDGKRNYAWVLKQDVQGS
jgi:hypothetical protein